MLKRSQKFGWSSGGYRDIAILNISDEQVELRTGMPLVKDYQTGFQAWWGVFGTHPSGFEVELFRYVNPPFKMTGQYIVRVDRDTLVESAITSVLDLLDLDTTNVDCRESETAT